MSQLALLEKIPQPDLGPNMVCSVYASTRARQVRISISYNEGLRIILPKRLSRRDAIVREILERRGEWIKKTWARINSIDRHQLDMPEFLEVDGSVISQGNIKIYARAKITKRVYELTQEQAIKFNRIFVRNQKRCWGSCSRRRNLNFNWRLILLPPELFDYVIWHELAHLTEMNHSRKFWSHLEEIYPGSKNFSKELKKYEY